jgi:DNA-binding Lrp family transcriptional regulator
MIPGWKEELEAEYLEVLRDGGRATPGELALRLGVSEDSAVYWLTHLARDGRVRILGVEAIAEGEARIAGPTARDARVRPSPFGDDAAAVLAEAA